MITLLLNLFLKSVTQLVEAFVVEESRGPVSSPIMLFKVEYPSILS